MCKQVIFNDIWKKQSRIFRRYYFNISRQTVSDLIYENSFKIIYHGLKPENILLIKDKKIKVLILILSKWPKPCV
jgi:serine/threonine protein kinase